MAVHPAEYGPEPKVAETTWLEGVVDIRHRESPQGPIILITLLNGHRYALPLFGPVRDSVYRISSPIAIASDLPVNGSGARSPSQ